MSKCLFTALILIFACSPNQNKRIDPEIPQEKWKITSFHYGQSSFQNRFLLEGSTGTRKDFSWLFYLLEKGSHKVLVDTGFADEKMIDAFGVDHHHPIALLHDYGLNPEDITHLVITHEHFDHCELAGEFKKAQVLASPWVLDQINLESRQTVVVESSLEFLPGLTMEVIGGHTPGSAVLWIEEDSPSLLVGDEIYLLESWRENIISGSNAHPQAARTFLDRIQSFPGNIYTFHDPLFAGPLGTSLELSPSLSE